MLIGESKVSRAVHLASAVENQQMIARSQHMIISCQHENKSVIHEGGGQTGRPIALSSGPVSLCRVNRRLHASMET